MSRRCSKRGSVSVFLLMTLSVSILLIGIFTEAAAGKAARAYAESVIDLAGRSVLSEFDRDLKADYGIFGIVSDTQTITDKLYWYLSESFIKEKKTADFFHFTVDEIEIDLSAYVLSNTESFEEQIIEFMKYRAIPQVLNLAGLMDEIENMNIDGLSEDEGIVNESGRRENRTLKNRRIIEELPSRLIDKQLWNLQDLIDMPDLSEFGEIAKEELYINLYIIDRFRHYLDSADRTDTFFVNETEYILYGSLSDQTNYFLVKTALAALRTGLNLTHIYSDPKKREALAAAASIITPGPAAAATQIALAGAWAAAEAVVDIKKLEKSKKVPLIKTEEDWVLSLDNVINEDLEPSEQAGEEGRGLTYENYLFLFLMDRETKLLRIMDLIQLNMKGNHNADFLITGCYSGIDIYCTLSRKVNFLGVTGNRKGVISSSHVY